GLRGDPLRGLGEDDHLFGDPRQVEQSAFGHAGAEVLRHPVAAIGDHDLAGQAFGADLVEQLQGDLALGLERTAGDGDPRPLQAFRVLGPGLGQVEPQRQGIMTLGADVVDRRGDLAIGFLPQRPAILALDTDGVLALLGEAGVVDDEDALRIGEGLGQQRTIAFQDLLLVPGALVDELLEGLLGVLDVQIGGRGDAPGEGPNALAFALLDQAGEVDAGPAGGTLKGTGITEVGGVVLQSPEDLGGQFGGVGLAHTLQYEQDFRKVRNG